MSSTEVLETTSLKCFIYHKQNGIKDEITFNIVKGDPPVVTTFSSLASTTDILTLSCNVKVKSLFAIHILDGNNNYMGDSTNEIKNISGKVTQHYIKFTHEDHKLQVNVLLKEYNSMDRPFLCVAHSPFGVKHQIINDDNIKYDTNIVKGRL